MKTELSGLIALYRLQLNVVRWLRRGYKQERDTLPPRWQEAYENNLWDAQYWWERAMETKRQIKILVKGGDTNVGQPTGR